MENITKIIELQEKENIANDIKLSEQYAQTQSLLSELREKTLPERTVSFINQKIHEINTSDYHGKMLRKAIKIRQKDIMYYVVEQKIMPKNFYKFRGISFGATVGFPFAMIVNNFFTDFGNNVFLLYISAFVIGGTIGALIGAYFGARKDKKAFAEGRQLKTNLSY